MSDGSETKLLELKMTHLEKRVDQMEVDHHTLVEALGTVTKEFSGLVSQLKTIKTVVVTALAMLTLDTFDLLVAIKTYLGVIPSP